MDPTRIDVAFDALTQLTDDGLALVNEDGHVLAWNDAAGRLTGVTPQQAMGSALHTLVRNPEVLTTVARAGTVHLLLLDPPSTVRAAAVRLPIGWLVSFGPQRRIRTIEQLKNEIVASISHELKTPIATIKAFATTLFLNPHENAIERTEYLNTIIEQADRLTHTVDDLLLAARVEVDHLLEQRVRIALDDVLDLCLAPLTSRNTERQIERHTGGIAICGDPALLEMLFSHIFENAIKFSANDTRIIVTATEDGMHTTVTIRDAGIGIDEEHLPYIFDRFYRAEENLTASTGGSGLGLYLASSIARAHGGTIRVESQLGAGSTFIVQLPVRV